jgi:hypothetical protein
MEQLVIVRAEAPGRYVARSLAIPEVTASADTEQGAIEQVRQSLAAWLSKGKVVSVQVPLAGAGNPWLDSFGRSADDPQFSDYQDEIQRSRAADGEP